MGSGTHFGKLGLSLATVSGALSVLAGMLQLTRLPQLMAWSVLLLVVAAGCYLLGLVLSLLGLQRDDSRAYATAALVLIAALALPLVPIWLRLVPGLTAGFAGAVGGSAGR